MKHFTLIYRLLAVLLGVSWLGLRPQQAQAQSYALPVSGTASYTTCSGTLYDNGGATGNYATSANGAVTLTPATTGNKIKLEFTSFLTESGYDNVSIYDGTSTSATLIGTYTGTNSPGTVYATTSSGALTVRLTSDGSVEYNGFAATISCVTTVPQPDLTVQSPALSPTTVVAGGYTSASASVYNLSGTTASSSNLGYYLSTDNALSSNDVLIGNDAVGSLGVGSSSSRTATLTVPTGTATGTYYVLFVADYLNYVAESNESNNVASVTLTVQASNPDLITSQATVSPTSATTGYPLSLSCYAYNQGTATATTSSVGFYLSSDATLDANDLLLTSQYGGSLAVSGSSSRSATATIPASVTAGNYYVLFAADYQNLVSESNENNNVSAVAITVLPSGADLTVTQQYLYSSSAIAGATTSAYAYVYNQGNVAASTSNLGFYLSTNTTFDSNDVLLSTSTGSTLAAFTSAYRSASLTIPSGTAAGSYYVLFVADPANAVTESNENNNVAYSSLTILAPTVDLLVYSPYLSSTRVAAGTSISPSCSIYNQGNSVANPATVGYYLSTDNTFSSNDVLIGNYSVGSIQGSSYGYGYGTATIPSGTAAGSYYVLFVADYLNQLTETNESNNVTYTSVQVIAPGVDLTVYSPSVSPSQTTAGSSISTSSYLNNLGTTAAGSSTVGYYLSTDNTLSSNDVLIGTSSSSSVSAGYYASLYGSATVPAGTASGTYYVLFVADYLNQITETDETNNVNYATLQVVTPSVDLTVYSAYVSPSQTTAGGSITTSCYLYNQGNTTASSSTVGYYLSTDNTLSSNDVLIGSNSVGSVSGGYYSSSVYGSMTIPSGTAAGSYYVLFVADYLNQVAETNENNNVNYATLQITAPSVDLTVYSASLSASQTVAGNTIYPSCYLYNQGSTTAGSSTVGYYLSTDNTLSSNDVLIGSYSVGSVSGYNYSSYLYGSATIPTSTASGNYYVLFVADYLNQVAETNENNNVNYSTLQVTAQGVDLTISSPAATPTSVTTGGTVSASCYIYNNGNASASSSTVGFYLSTNTTFDASDVLLNTTTGGSLAAGNNSYRSASLTIPSGTTAGTYYLLYVADPTNAVAENNENNNVNYLTLTVAGTFAGELVPASGTNTITTCSGRIYDNGGPGNYANNSNGTLTIYPGTTGSAVQLGFVVFATESSNDYLQVYDGTSTSAPLLNTFSGTTLPSTIQASRTNTSGALTLRFVSDGNTTAAGFEAVVSCVQLLAAREQTAGYALSVLPNPVAGATPLRVQLSGLGTRTDATLTLVNSLGQQVATQSLALVPGRTNEATVPTTGLATGVYLLHLAGADLNVTRRVVIE